MEDLYFKNQEAKIIFALVELDGKVQLNLLGIDYSHYAVIEADKKEVKSNFKNAREYEIRQMLEKIEEDYINYIRKSF